jgi:predicted NBD/HSP70 family sugar kinase
LAYSKELSALGLIKEAGLFKSTGGRKAKILVPNASAKLAIGLDITANHISLVLVDLLGKTRFSERITSQYSDDEAYYVQLGSLVQSFIDRYEIQTDNLIGIGVSIPCIINDDGTLISNSYVLKIRDVPCSRFVTNIHYPSIFMNDANAACLAEMTAIKTNEPIVVYLSLSNSVGGGIIWNNSIYFGDNQRSGEFGHICLIPNGKECYCGQKGCTDAYCSALVLAEHGNGSLSTFFANVDNGDESCKKVLDTYLKNLATVINNIRMAFDCQVIIGGYVGGYLDKYLKRIRALTHNINTFGDKGNYIHTCSYRYEASAVGAAMHHIKQYIETI